MNQRAVNNFMLGGLFTLAAGGFLFTALPIHAQETVASVSSFSGTVVVFSEDNITKVVSGGTPVGTNDMIMTKQGKARVSFSDGAVLDMMGHTLVMIQEGVEKKGGAGKVIGKKGQVRRITLYTGKMGFRSGSSQIRNCLQTPGAVCWLTGSEAQMCNDGATSSLQMLSGQADVIGDFVRGYCENPGVSAAEKNELFQQLAEAYEIFQTDPEKGRLMAVVALSTGVTLLLASPDPLVVQMSMQTLVALKAELEVLRAGLQKELGNLKELGLSDDEVSGEIRELEEEIRKLEEDLGEVEEGIELQRGVTTTTTTTTSTTTIQQTSNPN